ncbi:hypothetical protein ABE82_26495 (plasmid) [Paenibacillus peoriae]|uniref:hypothetical protein n=1 Tax=Paenibacillus peoriae TaxID=59893 RepID=UPI0007217974|nr:hypothetical protein [Paenibacillus peoriae]ALS09965.1 hypothetical protein ABE82_26495 [Paenibacillus peoriae]
MSEMYRLLTSDINHQKDLHMFEAENHHAAIVYASNHIKASDRDVWSAKLLSWYGTLMIDDNGELIEEEKIIAENEIYIKDEVGIYKMELGKEAYELFSRLYELSNNNKELLSVLCTLKNKYE